MKIVRIAIVGAGAIGGTLAARLIEQGYSLTVVDKNPEHIEAVNKHGLLIDGCEETHLHTKLKLHNKLNGLYDVVFLAVKSTHTQEACLEILTHLRPDGLLVSLQNGINNDQIIPLIGKERFIAGVVGFGATYAEPGHITITSKEKDFIVGSLLKQQPDLLTTIQRILGEVAPTEVSLNILGDQWGKLAMNCIINPFCAITNKSFGENVHAGQVRRQMQEILTEVLTVGKEQGIVFTKLAGKYNIENMFLIHVLQDIIDITNRAPSPTKRILDLLEYPIDIFRGSTWLQLLALKHGKIKSSMWQDLQRHQKTEIDFLNGYVSKKGREAHVATPANDRVVAEIQALEKKLCP
jgi:2-dehydropantoate 2-reductase